MKLIDEILENLKEAGLKINLPKSVPCHKELAWLGFWLAQELCRQLPNRIQGILDTAPLRNKKEVRMLVGMLNFTRNHVPRRAVDKTDQKIRSVPIERGARQCF